ncbi:MAG: type II toxin-antitoxin system RatA family toxin [Gammaproteobacteria bacterium]|nr:type II toxin-antitoxin system RatA family toxin [Gammaproteobacteria bacterium]
MPSVHRSAWVAYPAREMFALVADIPAYPEFLPWCAGGRVQAAGDALEACVDIRYGSVNKSFTTRNRHQDQRAIHMELVEGPFRFLHGQWRFEPEGEGSRISLDLEYEFSSRVAGLLIGPVFNGIAEKLVEAFVARADELHASDSPRPAI